MEKLGINPSLLGFQILNFAIIMAFLNFLILKPLSELMKKRKQKIEAGLAKEGEIDVRLAAIDADKTRQLSKVKKEIDQMMAEAAQKAIVIKEDVLTNARKEADALMAKARQRMAIEKEEMMAVAKNEVAELTIKAVERLFSDQKSSDIIKKQINQSTIEKLWQNHHKK